MKKYFNTKVNHLTLNELNNYIKNTNNITIAYFSASSIANISWCGDCNNANPAYNYLINKYSSKIYIQTYYIEKLIWKNKLNEYRQHQFFKIKCIPTLIYFNNGIELNRLEEGQITEESIDNLIEKLNN